MTFRSIRVFAATASLVAALLVASLLAATAQPRTSMWEPMACEQSAVAVPGHLACQVRRPLVALSDGGEIPTNYAAAGEIAGTRVRLNLSVAKAPQNFRPYTEQEAVRGIRAYAAELLGPRLTDWSGPSAQRALTFMTFRTEDRACFAFDVPGPPHPSSGAPHMHAWILRGIICPPEGQPVNRRAVIRYLESVRVAIHDPTRNALGTDLQPWP